MCYRPWVVVLCIKINCEDFLPPNYIPHTHRELWHAYTWIQIQVHTLLSYYYRENIPPVCQNRKTKVQSDCFVRWPHSPLRELYIRKADKFGSPRKQSLWKRTLYGAEVARWACVSRMLSSSVQSDSSLSQKMKVRSKVWLKQKAGEAAQHWELTLLFVLKPTLAVKS